MVNCAAFYLELVLDFIEFFFEEMGFGHGSIHLFLQDLGLFGEILSAAGLHLVAYPVALVISNEALGADVDLVVLAEVLGLLLRVLQAVLVLVQLLLVHRLVHRILVRAHVVYLCHTHFQSYPI